MTFTDIEKCHMLETYSMKKILCSGIIRIPRTFSCQLPHRRYAFILYREISSNGIAFTKKSQKKFIVSETKKINAWPYFQTTPIQPEIYNRNKLPVKFNLENLKNHKFIPFKYQKSNFSLKKTIQIVCYWDQNSQLSNWDAGILAVWL